MASDAIKTKRPVRSRLQQWLNDNGFTSADLEAVTGIDRKLMRVIRSDGRYNLRLHTMLRILAGARILAGRPVHILELFDLDSDDAPLPNAA